VRLGLRPHHRKRSAAENGNGCHHRYGRFHIRLLYEWALLATRGVYESSPGGYIPQAGQFHGSTGKWPEQAMESLGIEKSATRSLGNGGCASGDAQFPEDVRKMPMDGVTVVELRKP